MVISKYIFSNPPLSILFQSDHKSSVAKSLRFSPSHPC